MKVKREYDRLKALFDGSDEVQTAVVEGAILEAARLKVELDELNQIEQDSINNVSYNPINGA